MLGKLALVDFTKGEITPKLAGRWDLPLGVKGCLEMESWIPLPYGAIITRTGSKYLGLTKNNALGRLRKWTVGDGTTYVMEFTPLVLRFWTSAGALFGAPLELTTPYTTGAQCRALRFAQDVDVMFVVHPTHPIQKLTWTGSTFTIAAAAIVGNVGEVPFSAAGDYPAFIAGYGQRLWFGRSNTDKGTIWASRAGIYTEARGVAWQVSTAYELDDIVINDTGKLYTCVTAGTSAAAGGPTGTGSAITDGTCVWDYWCASGSIDMTYYQRQKFTTERLTEPAGWADPDIPELETVTVYRNTVTADAAMVMALAGDQNMDVQTLVSGDVLLVGTRTAEYIVPSDLTALTPEKLVQKSRYGSAAVEGFLMGGSVIFTQRLGTRLREYPQEGDVTAIPNLSFHAEHLLGASGTIVEADFTTVPYSLIYALRSDGVLLALGYDKGADMLAWCRIVSGLSGTYKSITVAAGTIVDVLWAIVLRGTQYCVEIFDGIEDMTAIPLDGWVNVATAGATVTGLDRFTDQTVAIRNITDGTDATAAVAAGVLTTPAACVGDNLVIGAPFTCTMQTNRLPSEDGAGPAMLNLRQVTKVYALVLASYPFKLGRAETASVLETTPWTGEYTGAYECPFQGESNRDTWIFAVQDTPYRSQILALVPEVDS